MSQEKRKLKRELRRKRKQKFQMILIGFILVFLIVKSIPSLFASASKTILPEPTKVEEKITGKGIIIKKEKIYKADAEGKIKLIKKEGERISAGSRAANLMLLSDTSTLNQKLEEVEEKIDLLTETEKGSEVIKNNGKNVEESIDDIIYELQSSIAQENYKKSEILKAKISIYNINQKDITGEKTLIGQSLDSLKNQYDNIIEQISANSIGYFPDMAGIISFSIDGYEEEYNSTHRENYILADFDTMSIDGKKIEDNENVKIGDPIFKIIDNFEWHMLIRVENMKAIESYNEGDSILVAAENIEDNFRGSIESIKEEKEEVLLVCKFTSDFQKIYDKRFINIDIIKSNPDGFKIPTRSITTKDGIKGVYIKSISGVIRFRPIVILKEENKSAYIKGGDEDDKIDIRGSDKLEKTITDFDEILKNTINIKEGMIID